MLSSAGNTHPDVDQASTAHRSVYSVVQVSRFSGHCALDEWESLWQIPRGEIVEDVNDDFHCLRLKLLSYKYLRRKMRYSYYSETRSAE